MAKVLIVADLKGAEVRKPTLELLTKARQEGLAADAAVLGSGVAGIADLLAGHGAQKVYLADDAALEFYSGALYLGVLAEAAKQSQADQVWFSVSETSKALAPALAGRMDGGYINDAVALKIEGNTLEATRPVMAAKVLQKVRFKTAGLKVISFRGGAFDLEEAAPKTADVVKLWPRAEEFGFPNEEAAFALQYGHGVGLSIWEKPVVLRNSSKICMEFVAKQRRARQRNGIEMPGNLLLKLQAAVNEGRTINDLDNIYLVEDGIIGKRCRNKERAYNEYEIGKFLFENGVQVPKMFNLITPGSFMIRKSSKNSPKDWFILMERIKGKTIKELAGIEKKEAIEQRKSELEKVLALNVHHPDSAYDDNSIYDAKQKKLYLIDFEHWRKL
ncbi:MAG: hypothetical protein IH788_02660 [Nitrospinae bacterium]|nr:hypothetical protein [Nitrospinota bacterium]